MFEVRRHGNIAEVLLAHPPLNVLRHADWLLLGELLGELEEDAAVGAVMFHGGSSRAFSAGNDFCEFPGITREQLDDSTAAIRDALKRLDTGPLLSVAAIHGPCFGSALLLACCCDIRIATADASFALPEIKVGAIGGYQIVRTLLPVGEARRLAFTGDILSAERAHELGLVQEISDAPIGARGLEIAETMASNIKAGHKSSARRMLLENDRAELWEAHERERLQILDYMTAS